MILNLWSKVSFQRLKIQFDIIQSYLKAYAVFNAKTYKEHLNKDFPVMRQKREIQLNSLKLNLKKNIDANTEWDIKKMQTKYINWLNKANNTKHSSDNLVLWNNKQKKRLFLNDIFADKYKKRLGFFGIEIVSNPKVTRQYLTLRIQII